MARRPALSTSSGEELYVEETRDDFTFLDVVHANQFEGETIDQEVIEETEVKFYRGAPPEWLNFHIGELSELNGSGSPFIKRDGYSRLVQQIHKKKKGPGISTVKFFHQQGCGGTTLAMQLLWDMRKTFRCAVLMGSTLDITKVAKEVVHLFTGGSEYDQNTVLLLLNNDFILDQLQDCIMAEITEQEVDVDVPVVVLLNCVRTDHIILRREQFYKEKEGFKGNDREDVFLKTTLSDTEKEQFDAKKEELSRRYGDKARHFYGFNILQTNFSRDYIQEVCAIFKKIERRKKPLKTQLVAFLSLLNAYVPGSYLLESECLDFLRRYDSSLNDLQLVDLMQPFSHLILSFKREKRCENKIRMVHPMIAKCCTELLAEGGVTRSDTARNFLISFCEDDVSPCLFGFIKDLLTKREKKKDERVEDSETFPHLRGKNEEEDVERYSRLILRITEKEDRKESASVLKVASNKFAMNSVFPQTLARLCYGELKDYKEAEMWAKTAKERDPKKSFIADTLGQVHKNHLKNKEPSTEPRELLQLAKKAIDAFEEEEQLAEEELKKSTTEDEKSKVPRELNTRGQFGFLQVCHILFDRLSTNKTWREVLTNKISMGSALKSLGDNKLFRFHSFINDLREKVEKRYEFLDTFLTYSESTMRKDKAYISREAAESYRKFVGDSGPRDKDKFQKILQNLKEKLAVTSAGVLSCLDRRCLLSDVQQIAKWWEEMCQSKEFTTRAFVNFILAKIMLSNKTNTPLSSDYQNTLRQNKSSSFVEYHMLGLLLFWPTEDEDQPLSDLSQLIEHVKRAYEQEYATTFQSRRLRPLFFIGPGKSLNRFVHRRILEIVWTKDALIEPNTNWRSENIFKDPIVQERLLKVDGVVRHYRVYATFRGMEVEVEANRRDGLWKSGDVTFYLGFTVRGPVAFSIQRRLAITEGSSRRSKHGACGRVMDSCPWTKVEPEVKKVNETQTYSLQSDSGCFECSVSSLRWVCKEPISFEYQFDSWARHSERLACMDCMPAGPLLDISVTAGNMEEVHLPHWIDAASTSPDTFAVLHVQSCGDAVEHVTEVTSSHVKLLQPTFSPKGVIIRIRLGLPVKVYHDILIFKTKQEFLTLRVYLVPPDPDLQQTVERKESSFGSILIPKPSPGRSLQMLDHFLLKTDADNAEIHPERMKLKYDRRIFFEVFIRKADGDFNLKLKTEKKNCAEEMMWICFIRKGDYRNSNSEHRQGQHFLDVHRTALIERVTDTHYLLDKLLELSLISNEKYDSIRTTSGTHEQMRDILSCVSSSGPKGKDSFYKILKDMRNLRPLLSELEESQQGGTV